MHRRAFCHAFMDTLLPSLEDQQQLPMDHKQQAEDILGWVTQPPDWSLAAHSQIAEWQPHQPTGIDMSTIFPMAMQDSVQATPWETFPSRYQSSAMTEYSYMHRTTSSSEVRRQLIVEDMRHFEARERILGRSQTYPMVPQQQDNTIMFTDTNFGTDGATDTSILGFLSANTSPSQSLMSNNVMNAGRQSYGFDPSCDTWHTQTNPQAVFDPSFSSGYTQRLNTFDTTSCQFPYTNASSSYLTNNLQQPVIQQMPLRPSTNDTPYFGPNAYLQEAPAPNFSAPGQIGSTQRSIVQNDGAQLFSALDPSSTAFASSHNIDMAASNTVPSFRNEAPPSGYDITNEVANDLPFIPIKQAGSLNHHLRTGYLFGSQAPTMEISRKRALSSSTLASTETLAPHSVPEHTNKAGNRLVIVPYESPEAERTSKKARPNSRTVREKAAWACFRCFFKQAKVNCFSIVSKCVFYF
jgi:hypothetical protein